MRNPGRQGLYDPQFEHESCGVGFAVNMKGRASHDIVRQGLQILVNLEHRGACGFEENTGDGAGILIQMPHKFLAAVAAEEGIELPEPGHYGVAMVFLPPDKQQRHQIEKRFEQAVRAEGQKFLGWRTVPTDNSDLGDSARSEEPEIRMAFVGRKPAIADDLAFERKLYVIRRRVFNEVRYAGAPGGSFLYVPSFSSRTLVYKGMLTPRQVEGYYRDLSDPRMESALALVHSRFSTNTFPSWDRAHPYRYVAHNGEINTLRGNVNWMHAREPQFASPLFGNDIQTLRPVVHQDGSDSAMFDNCFEFLVLSGRSLAHAAVMMIPEPWANNNGMPRSHRDFYEYHSCLMEPWDGPAAVAFTDGTQIGAVLDRNGLRPCRYYVTKDDLVIMASEVGVLDIEPERILQKGRLQPGRIFLVDTKEGRIISDEEIKASLAGERPYRRWVEENLVKLEDLPDGGEPAHPDHEAVATRQFAFGYTQEDLNLIIAPMARMGAEPIGSMGNDAPPAPLSDQPKLLYNYFKQLFAQVTNPPIDSIREEIVTSTLTTLGSERNLLDPQPESCRQIQLSSPVITNGELEKLRALDRPGFKSATLPILYDVSGGGPALEEALARLFDAADSAIADGVNILILSDRGITAQMAPIPALLAVSGLHHHLVANGRRTQVGLVLESGEPREVHHFALLVGYGAGAINPYLAFESIEDIIRRGNLAGVDFQGAIRHYVKAATKGIVKTMSKMGISTIQSYRGAQIFEAIGLDSEVIDTYFRGTASRIEGMDLDGIAREAGERHCRAWPRGAYRDEALDAGGVYKWRPGGEHHAFNPTTIHLLQHACRTGSMDVFRRYSDSVNDQSKKLATLRGLLDFKFPGDGGVPLDEVEPVESIMKRFKTGAMSYGSISQEAHETLAIAMNRIGGKSNTGEGGEDPARYDTKPGGDSKNSAIKQVASGRFGVTSYYLSQARELQIKIVQGAKPGEGGQLPGTKVYPWIAKVRHSTPGVGLISPPPHHDIYSIEDLAELIHDLKNANRHARISVKLVSEAGVGTVAAGVAKAHGDVVLISGHDGGTGASPLSSIQHAGMPWELGLAETHQTLLLNNLRSRIVVEVDGQLKTGRDVVIGALLGAEEFGFATAPLVVMGCIMMRVCHLNTCPVGVATQDPELRKKFTGDPAHVVNFMRFIAAEVRELMAQLGFRSMDEMVGRVDRLAMRKAVEHWKARGLDYSRILYDPDLPDDVGRRCTMKQDHGIEKSLDITTLLKICEPAIERGKKVHSRLPIKNVNRVTGTILGYEISKAHGLDGLPEDTITLDFVGSAGQSFGAFAPRGLTMRLEGDANDYVGKGLSGGRIIVYPPFDVTFDAGENIIIGNVALYGATGGEAYIRGMAGERFCVRNSGASAVVESVGDHGCEYMTGGRVVVLGPTGRNFAAGMSGGIAYVYDTDGTFHTNCNMAMVDLERLDEEAEIAGVKSMIARHAEATGSVRARDVLNAWDSCVPKFIRVMPKDYRRVLQAMDRVIAAGLDGEEAVMAAFEENIRDAARAGGN